MLKKLQNWFTLKKKTFEQATAVTVKFLHMLEVTNEEELSCGEVHDLIDQYVELKRHGENVDALMPLVKHHLEICRECFDEYEALMAVLELEETL